MKEPKLIDKYMTPDTYIWASVIYETSFNPPTIMFLFLLLISSSLVRALIIIMTSLLVWTLGFTKKDSW
jgi:hypothetical protein